MQVALKIDVDTHDGLRLGVPRLAALLEAEQLTASFYVAMGPDNSGKAILRVFRNRGFIKKMFRTKALAMYGWRTILSGTILPARQIALAFPDIVHRLADRGFEVGVHGFDHVRWQDHIEDLGESGIGQEIECAMAAYQSLFGHAARSFAAPGWRENALSLRLLDSLGLDYHSDTRGVEPFLCAIDGRVLTTMEIPTTLPTLDELMGGAKLHARESMARYYLEQFKPDRLNVHTIHAETEGISQLEGFACLVRALKSRGAQFVRLDQIAHSLDRRALPICEVTRATLPGRAGWIAAQGLPLRPEALRAR
jgi:undecaprenyl phosphate-alpha-L-ara4FN deformylase